MKKRYLLIALSWLLGPSLVQAQQPLANHTPQLAQNTQQHLNVASQNEQSTTLSAAVKELADRYQVSISYDPLLLDQKTIRPLRQRTSLEEDLSGLLAPHSLRHRKLEEGFYIIQPTKIVDSVTRLAPQGESFLPSVPSVAPPQLPTAEKPVRRWEQTISGQVTDGTSGESLPGVNILAKGTSTGTVTDIDGNYRLTVADDVATLVFSSIGYATQEVAIGGRSTIDLALTPDVQSLSEVVVVGYGTTKRSDLTGSVATVKEQELKQVAVASLDQGLQGRIAGVQVTQASAAPGGAVSVRIRGVNSINGTNEPLYVIDGIPIIPSDGAESPTGGGVPGQGGGGIASNALASINPGDIESIEVLKDASAAAIYGARGANGVVIITTKQGKAGRTTVDFENYYGVQEVANTYDVLDARSFGIWANEYALSQGQDRYFNEQQLDSLGRNSTNWQDQIYRTAPMQNHQLTITSGNDKTTFSLGANYFRQEGVVKRSGFERASLRLNLNHLVSDKFKVGTSLMISRLGNDRVLTDGNESVTSLAQKAPPVVPVFDRNGDYTVADRYGLSLNSNLDLNEVLPNPVGRVNETDDRETTNRILTNLYAEYEFVEGLSLKVTGGANLTNRNRDTYYSQRSFEGEGLGGFASTGNSERLIFLNENILSFNRTYGGKHRVSAVTGFSTQYEIIQGRSINNTGFGIDDADLSLNDIGSGTQLGGPGVGSFKRDESLASFILRASYGFDDRYLLTFTSRADGSSKFSEGNKWGFFPSAAVGWNLGNEAFMNDVSWISSLKLRGSYGQTGFQEILPYQSLARYGSQNYSFGDVPVVGYQPLSPANRDLTWQITSQVDVGVDASLFENRLTLIADYYVKNTDRLLLFVRPPANTGYSGALAFNIGEVRNQGWELSVGTNLNLGAVRWTSNLNLSRNTNEVLDLGPQEEIFGGRLSADRKDQGNRTAVGEPIGVFYGYQSDGIFRDEAEVSAHTTNVDGQEVIIQPDAQPGDRRFVDVNEDGDISNDDRTTIGDPYADLIYGWSNNFYYGNFDFSFFLQGTQGNDILNVSREPLSANNTQNNILQDRFDGRWTAANPSAVWPRAGAFNPIGGGSGGFGDYIVEDGSYLRLRDITLGYTVPASVINGLRTARIYVSAQNLFTITSYSGVNPEASSQGQSATNFGVDIGGYPVARIYRLGINLGF